MTEIVLASPYPVIASVRIALLTACTRDTWGNPYRVRDAGRNIAYRSISERPEQLDPVGSYGSNEYLLPG